MNGTPVPPEIMFSEIVGIFSVTIIVIFAIIYANAKAVSLLKAEQKEIQMMHWFPSILTLLFTVVSLSCSFIGVYEWYLDQLYAPAAFGIVLPIIILIIYTVRSQTLRELLEVIPLWWYFIPHLTRFSGFAILMLYTHNVLPAHVAYAVGWGDVLCAVLALPVAWAVAKRVNGWQKIAIGFAVLGIIDYVLALQLTVFTLPIPIRLIHTPLDSTVLAMFPVGIAPTLYVPLLYLTLFSIIIKVKQLGRKESA